MIWRKSKKAASKHNRPQGEGILEPLLILGEGRSGTTLLMQLLGTSPQIAFDRLYPFENRYLTYLMRWALLLGQQWEPEPDWSPVQLFASPGGKIGPLPFQNVPLWEGQKLWPKCFASAWQEFSRIAQSKTKRRLKAGAPILYYAEKSPHWLPEYLGQVMPFKAIVLVRDPRDVFLSINAFNQKRGFSSFGRLEDDDDWTFARRFIPLYKERFKVICEEEAASHTLLVKYENLAIDLENETERVSQWLGVNLDARKVEESSSKFAHHMTSRNPHESVERWRREMSPKLTDFFRQEMREELRHFGYEN